MIQLAIDSHAVLSKENAKQLYALALEHNKLNLNLFEQNTNRIGDKTKETHISLSLNTKINS